MKLRAFVFITCSALVLLSLAGCAGARAGLTRCPACGWLVEGIGTEGNVSYYRCLAWGCQTVTGVTNSYAKNF